MYRTRDSPKDRPFVHALVYAQNCVIRASVLQRRSCSARLLFYRYFSAYPLQLSLCLYLSLARRFSLLGIFNVHFMFFAMATFLCYSILLVMDDSWIYKPNFFAEINFFLMENIFSGMLNKSDWFNIHNLAAIAILSIWPRKKSHNITHCLC